MSDTVKTALISAVVAVITAVVSAFTTIYLKSAELRTASESADSASASAQEAKRSTTDLLQKVEAAQESLSGRVWTRARLEPDWSIYGGEYSDPSYSKDRLNVVRLRGIAKGGAPGPQKPMLILPEGFRPEAQQEFPVACGNNVPCEIIIQKSGLLYVETHDASWVSLDGVAFTTSP